MLDAIKRINQLLVSGVIYFRDASGFRLHDIELRDELIRKNG